MVKRGIGAAVLAIVAALLLGYLLKGKGQERQEVVDMNLPGAIDVKQSLNIPSLKGADDENTAQNAADTTDTSGALKTAAGVAAGVAAGTIVASATGAADKVNQATKDIKTKEIAVNTFKNKGDDLDFTIRPPKGERREIVDNIGKSKQQIASVSSTTTRSDNDKGDIAASADAKTSTSTTRTQNSGSITRSSPSQGRVVASSEEKIQKKVYRHRLVDEKKRSASYGIVVAENSSTPSRTQRERRERRKAAELKTADKKKAQAKQQSKSTGKGRFSVQLLATSSSSRANNLKKVMSEEGYRVSVSKTAKQGKVLFRVRIGNYSTRAAAASAQRNMKRRYKRNQAVNASIIVSR
jgi:cell division septation protein DedD